MTDFVGQLNDFDFLVGDTWKVANRRLRIRLGASSDWYTFDATQQAWSLLDGGVSVDEMKCPSEGFSGCTVRTLDRVRKQWSIHWINSNSGKLFPPVHGGFAGARGEFYGEDEDDGRPVKVRFIWNKLGPDAARWEQAFSLDGREWETNWVMDFTRG